MTIKTAELWIGLTDLPICISALVFALLIRKSSSENRKIWGLEYTIIACGALLGSIVHCFEMPVAVNKALWVVLYVFLYAMCFLFFSLMYEALKGRKPDKIWLKAAAVCMVASWLIKLFINRNDLDVYVLVIYAMVPTAIVIAECIRQGKSASRERLLLILLGLALVSQAMECVFNGAAVITGHLLMLAALLALFELAKNPKGESDNE